MPNLRFIDEDGEEIEVPAEWEQDDFVVALGPDGNMKIYDTENNLDDSPKPGGCWVNNEYGIREGDEGVKVIYTEEDED